jgi:hypothetical protein
MAILPKQARVNLKKQEVLVQKLTTNPNATTSTVTQITTRSTGVTLNTTCGQITTDTTSLAAAAEAVMVVTNDKVKAKDVVVVAIASGGVGGVPMAGVTAVADGSFTITYTNTGGVAETGALVINFIILGAE